MALLNTRGPTAFRKAFGPLDGLSYVEAPGTTPEIVFAGAHLARAAMYGFMDRGDHAVGHLMPLYVAPLRKVPGGYVATSTAGIPEVALLQADRGRATQYQLTYFLETGSALERGRTYRVVARYAGTVPATHNDGFPTTMRKFVAVGAW